MIFAQHIPRFPLNEFVDSFVYFRGLQVDHRIERLLPDGNVVLIIDLTDRPQFIYDDDTLQEKQTCRRAWFSGLQQQGLNIPSGNGGELFVTTFRKGRSFPFTRTPLSEFTNHVVDGELALTHDILDLRAALQDQVTPQAKFAYAEEALLRRFGGGLEANCCVDYAVARIEQAPQDLTIAEITRKVGYSQKHFIQLFKKQVGVTPKRFLRIMRFQKALGQISPAAEVNWAGLAADCGYFDQAHMIAEFRSLAGLTPGEYQRKTGPYPGYVVVA